jgi:hypothetical protein
MEDFLNQNLFLKLKFTEKGFCIFQPQNMIHKCENHQIVIFHDLGTYYNAIEMDK